MRSAQRSARALACFAFAAILTIGLVACGGGGPREPTAEERAAIEENYDAYIQGFIDGDAKAICDVIAQSRIDEIGEEACIQQNEALADQKAFVEGLRSAEVERIEVADDDSIARMYLVGIEAPLRFLPEDGSWYVLPTPIAPPAT
jgi:hypothetical protein